MEAVKKLFPASDQVKGTARSRQKGCASDSRRCRLDLGGYRGFHQPLAYFAAVRPPRYRNAGIGITDGERIVAVIKIFFRASPESFAAKCVFR
jgi:hypothetical protein